MALQCCEKLNAAFLIFLSIYLFIFADFVTLRCFC